MYSKPDILKFTVIGLAYFFLLTLKFAASPACADTSIARLEWENDTFYESYDNDGTFTHSKKVRLIPESHELIHFNQTIDMVKEGWVDVEQVPPGLTCRIRSDNGYTVEIFLDGQATYHQAEDNITNLEIEFLDDAFTNERAYEIRNRYRNDLKIVFDHMFTHGDIDRYDGSLEWSVDGFNESEANDGSIDNEISVTMDIFSDDFDGFIESDDMIDDGMAVVSGIPSGLRCIIATENGTIATIRLEGAADAHNVDDYVDNIEIEFLDSAFANANASRIENNAWNSMEINYIENDEEAAEPQVPDDITSSFVLDSPDYVMNGVYKTMDIAPFAQNGRSYIPVRYLAYCLGMNDQNLKWNSDAKTATLTEGGTVVVLQIDSPIMLVNGVHQEMDVAPLTISGRIFLPARFVVEAFGGDVDWLSETETIMIYREIPVPE